MKNPYDGRTEWNLKLDSLPYKIGKALEPLDLDVDGRVNVEELSIAVALYDQSKKHSMLLKRLLLAAIFFLLLMLAGSVGILFTCITMAKETVVRGDGRMTLTGMDTLVRMGDSEMKPSGKYRSTIMTNTGKLVGTAQARHL